MAIKVSGTTVIDDSRNLQNSTNLNATGNVYANTFIGDGSQLTNLPASGGTVTATASGTLSDGTTVVVNSDGTVSAVAKGVTAGSASSRTSTHNVYTLNVQAGWVKGHLIVAYADSGNSYYGYAVMGTIEGSTITFNTPIAFVSSSLLWSMSSAVSETPGMEAMIMAYSHNGESRKPYIQPLWINGTPGNHYISAGSAHQVENRTYVSGLSIAYSNELKSGIVSYENRYLKAFRLSSSSYAYDVGSEVDLGGTKESPLSMGYASNEDKFLMAYKDNSVGTFRMATHDGTSTSLVLVGSETTFSGTDEAMTIAVDYHPVQQKVVIGYRNNSADDFDMVLGTISGNTIGFATPFTVSSTNNPYNITMRYDPFRDVMGVAWSDSGDSTKGKYFGLTVSGNTATVGSQIVFNDNRNTQEKALVYSANGNYQVVVYRDNNTNYLYSEIVQAENSNLNSDNFLGFSNGAYANGASATIQIAGSVEDAQSGLTPGQSYFVQRSGAIATTADTPSVNAGRAVSSTKLLVKD